MEGAHRHGANRGAVGDGSRPAKERTGWWPVAHACVEQGEHRLRLSGLVNAQSHLAFLGCQPHLRAALSQPTQSSRGVLRSRVGSTAQSTGVAKTSRRDMEANWEALGGL